MDDTAASGVFSPLASVSSYSSPQNRHRWLDDTGDNCRPGHRPTGRRRRLRRRRARRLACSSRRTRPQTGGSGRSRREHRHDPRHARRLLRAGVPCWRCGDRRHRRVLTCWPGVDGCAGRALATGIPNDRPYTVARALSVATGIGRPASSWARCLPSRRSRGRGRGLVSATALEGGTVTGPAYVTLTIGIGVGFIGFGAAVASRLDRTWTDLDLQRPGLRDIGYSVGGVVVLMVALLASVTLFRRSGSKRPGAASRNWPARTRHSCS